MMTTEIHPDDLLFDYLRRVPFKGDADKARNSYLIGGRDCAKKVRGSLPGAWNRQCCPRIRFRLWPGHSSYGGIHARH
jgi:hypothetical protein